MGFIANGIRTVAGLNASEDRSYNWESGDGQDDANAIMLLAAAIAAGLVEIVEDGIISLISKK